MTEDQKRKKNNTRDVLSFSQTHIIQVNVDLVENRKLFE